MKFLCDSYLKKVKQGSVICYNIYSNEEAEIKADTTYFVSWPESNDDLAREAVVGLRGIETYSIGDCVSPRSVEEAVFEGHELGRRV